MKCTVYRGHPSPKPLISDLDAELPAMSRISPLLRVWPTVTVHSRNGITLSPTTRYQDSGSAAAQWLSLGAHSQAKPHRFSASVLFPPKARDTGTSASRLRSETSTARSIISTRLCTSPSLAAQLLARAARKHGPTAIIGRVD